MSGPIRPARHLSIQKGREQMIGKTVSDVVLEVLAEAGAERIYGIPGDAINSLVEAIRKQDRLKFIQVRHEEAGAFAASAEAKLTGKLGVCVGTAGPGAVHLLNGLYDAKLDHAPVLAITGQVPTSRMGSDHHQEIDLYTLFKDVSVFNQVVVDPDQMPLLIVQACQAAISRSGVAHISLPVNIANARASSDSRRHVFTGESLTVPCPGDVDKAANLLNDSKRVAILAGIGALNAKDALLDVASALQAPIIKTLRGKEVLPDEHPFCMGGLGLLGTRPAVQAIAKADALLMVGTDFPYHDFYPDEIPAVQIDLEAGQLGKRYPVTVGLRGHANLTLEGLRSRLTPKDDRSYLADLQEEMADWWAALDRQEQSDSVPIRPQVVARTISDLAQEDAIFICDTGAVTVWGARHLRLRAGQRFTLSSSLASMAFGLPGAIGAQLAYPGHQVIALVGDGGFVMLMGDLVTAVKYELPITIVVFNNAKLGLIQMEQEVQGYPEYQTQLHNPDFVRLAEACGVEGYRVSSPSDLTATLSKAFASKNPSLVEVEINPEERTLPPKIEASQAFGYGLAKAREFFGLGDKDGGASVLRELLP